MTPKAEVPEEVKLSAIKAVAAPVKTVLSGVGKQPGPHKTKQDDFDCWKAFACALHRAVEHNWELQHGVLDLITHLKSRIAAKDSQIAAFRELKETLEAEIASLKAKLAELPAVRSNFNPGRAFPHYKRDRATFENYHPQGPAPAADSDKKPAVTFSGIDLTRDY